MALDPLTGAAVGIGSTVVGGLLGGNDKPRNPGRAEEFQLVGNPSFDASFNKTRGMDHLTIGADGRMGRMEQDSLKRALKLMGMGDKTGGLLGGMGMDFMNQLGSTDPMDIARSQYELLAPILNKDFAQDRFDLESRQFSQGRLGSTGGAQDFGSMLEQQNDARTKLLFDSFNQGLATQQHMYGLGSGLLQLDPTIRGMFDNLSTNALSNALNINNQALDFARVGGGIAGAGTGGGGGGTRYSASDAIGAGLVNTGVDVLDQVINDAISGGGGTTNDYFEAGR